MKGLFTHAPIIDELLKHITPLEYLVLRRTFPIFIRNPEKFPSVEEMGNFNEIFPNSEEESGFAVLLALHGEDISSSIAWNSFDVYSGLCYSKKYGLKIAYLGDAVKRIYHADTLDRAIMCLYVNTNSLCIECIMRATFETYEEYANCGFTIFVHHDPGQTVCYVDEEPEDYYDDDDDDDEGKRKRLPEFEDEEKVADYWNECVTKKSKKLKRADIVFLNEM